MTKSCIQKDLIRKCKLPSYSSYKCFGKIIKTKLHGMQLLIQDFLGRGERQPIRRCQPIITGRNDVVAKVMFLLVSVILSTGGRCLPQCMLGYPPGADTPQGRHHPPEQTSPLGTDTPLGADTPRADTPREQTPTPRKADSSMRSMSGRYASYWNAFLFCQIFPKTAWQ